MTEYTATAERGARRWLIQCDQVDGAFTEVARLDQARDWLREVIAFVTQQPEDQVVVTEVRIASRS